MSGVVCDNCGEAGAASRAEAGAVAGAVDLWYCVECGETFCYGCVGCVHAAGTKRARHRLEEVVPQATARVLPYLYDAAVVAGLAYGLVELCGWDREGYAKAIHCPCVAFLKAQVVRDPVVYYQSKPYWATSCDAEDSVLRYFTDAWVRGVVTGTDSWYLLILQLQGAMVGTVVALLLLPILCGAAAAGLSLLYIVEAAYLLPALPPAPVRRLEAEVVRPCVAAAAFPLQACVALAYATPLAGLLKGMRVAGGRRSGGFGPPPLVTTAPRATLLYRCFIYYYRRCLAVAEEFFVTVGVAVFAVRFALLWAAPSPEARAAAAASVGLGGALARHQTQFAGMPQAEPASFLLETLVRSALGEDADIALVAACTTLLYMAAMAVCGW